MTSAPTPGIPSTIPAESPAPKPPRKKKSVMAVIGSIASAVLILIAIGTVSTISKSLAEHSAEKSRETAIEKPVEIPEVAVPDFAAPDTDRDLTQRFIEREVAAMKADLPMDVDAVTTWTDVTAEPSAIHFHYTIDPKVDPAPITSDQLREGVMPNICVQPDTVSLLSKDLTMRVSYTFLFDGTLFEFDITKDSC